MPRIVAHSAVLTVRDVAASLPFWKGVLGFSTHVAFGEPPEFAIVTRDGAFQMLGQAKPGTLPPLRRDQRSGLMDAYFWVDDARAFHNEVVSRGGKLAAPLEQQPYGVLEFMVEDPDGHHIAFGQDLDGAVAGLAPGGGGG